MSIYHQERLVNLLVTYNEYQDNIDFTGLNPVYLNSEYCDRDALDAREYPYDDETLLPSEIQNAYNNPIESATNDYLDGGSMMLFSKTATERDNEKKTALNITEFLRYRNDLALIRDFYQQQLNLYNQVNRFKRHSYDGSFTIYFIGEAETRLIAYGSNPSDTTTTATFNTVTRSWANSYRKENWVDDGGVITLRSVETRTSTFKIAIGGSVPTTHIHFLDECKLLYKYDSVFNSKVATLNYTNGETQEYTNEPPPSRPQPSTPTYYQDHYVLTEVIEALKEMTWQDLAQILPKPATWL